MTIGLPWGQVYGILQADSLSRSASISTLVNDWLALIEALQEHSVEAFSRSLDRSTCFRSASTHSQISVTISRSSPGGSQWG
ncbi:hypothetical protein D3C75_1158040 [compost metagenome]